MLQMRMLFSLSSAALPLALAGQAVQAAPPPAGPSAAAPVGVQLRATTSNPSISTFTPGQPVSLRFAVTGMKPGAATTLAVTITDDRQVTVLSKSVKVTADATGAAQVALDAPHGRLGYYEVAARLADGTAIAAEGTRPAGITSYAVVPDPAGRTDYGPDLSHFAMQGGFSSKAQIVPLLGLRYYLDRVQWHWMEEKAPGDFAKAWDSERARNGNKPWPKGLDQDMAPSWQGKPWAMYPIAAAMGSGVPDWALVPGTGGKICKTYGRLNAQGKAALPVYAAALARAFAHDYPTMHKRIYQMAWEPGQGWCFGGTNEDLIEYFRLTYDAIHAADPDAVVAGPTLFPSSNYDDQLRGLWAGGLGRYIDAYSIHPYSPGDPPETHGLAEHLRTQIAAAERSGGHPIGLVGTEHGSETSRSGNRGQARENIRVTLIMLGEGASVDTAFYVADFWGPGGPRSKDVQTHGFYWNLNDRLAFGTDRIAPKMSVPAYAAMTRLLDGTTTRGPLSGLLPTQRGYRFVRGGTTIDVVWDYAGTSSRAVPRGAQVCDWMGNCRAGSATPAKVDGQPVYIVTGPV
ncbi:hypothetical protein [Novosphingobium olei]|uniref:Uncharacterized protein n=1 Tax=Novosphingobium olei TaxID=2728851 RepID=A0A7Y0BNY5_9SPHN|nr:hypothetical protein [Novosphingobium olei]NML93902.1 hypothetical protein [Novosphingobium olei]